MSRHIQNAGAFYAYITEGLGNRQGIGAAILALASYNMMQIGLYGLFGFASSSLLGEFTGLTPPWWVMAIACWILVGILGTNSIDLSAKVLGIIVSLEFLVVIIVDAMSVISPAEGLNGEAFAPDEFFVPGIGLLFAFGIAAFMGFESGAIYSEEVVDPRRTVSRATYIAVSVIALFYAFSAWAFSMGVGNSGIVEQPQTYGPDLVFVWLAERSPFLAHFANILFVTSLIAVLLAFHNAAARYFYSLGRSTVLLKFLAQTSRSGAPRNGSLTQSIIAILVIIGFAIAGAGSEMGALFPVNTLFIWLTNAAAFGLVFLLALTAVAIFAWFLKNPRGRSLWVRMIAPAISAIGLFAIFIMILLNFDLMIDAEEGSALIFVVPGIIIGCGIVGWVWGEIIRRRRPEDYERMRDADALSDEEELAIAEESVALNANITIKPDEEGTAESEGEKIPS